MGKGTNNKVPPGPGIHRQSKRSQNSNHKGQSIQLWSIQVMKDALMYFFSMQSPSYLGSRFRYKTFTKLYGLLPKTFHCRTTGPLKGFYSHLSGGKGIPRIFTPDEETELVSHITKFAQAGFPFTPAEIRSIAFEFVELNSIQGFNPKSLGKLVGRKWLKEFLSRYDNLSISTPKLLSIHRVNCTNLTVITK